MRSLTVATAAALVLLSAAPAWAEPGNSPPVVVDDAVTYYNTGGIDYPVKALANDSDPDGDPLTYVSVTPADKGNAYLKDGTLLYKPYFRESGTDSFTYTVSDGQGNTATSTVTATLWVDLTAPSSLTIGPADESSATLTWPAAPEAVQYQVFRNDVPVATTSDLTWTDTGLSPDRRYEYRVASVNGGGWAGAPSEVRVFRQPRQATPTGLAVEATDDPTSLKVTWPGTGLAGSWVVYRDGVQVGTAVVDRFMDSGLVTGQEYSYQVQRVSPWSSSTENFPPSLLTAPVTGTPTTLTDIGDLFYRWGGRWSELGPVTVAERAVPGGRQQDHRNGVIVQQDGADPLTVMNDFATAFAATGGVQGELGFPRGQASICGVMQLAAGCLSQSFERGSIWSSTYTPTRVVRPVIKDGWAEANGAWGLAGWSAIGLPVEEQVPVRGGVAQLFQDGGVYWSPATGSHGVIAETNDTYLAWGGPAGRLGFPTTGETCGLRADGCWQGFQGGSIHWSPATGAHVTDGAMRDTWARTGWENGRLGYPTTDAVCGLRGGGCWQGFQGGTIHWSPAAGAHATDGAMRDAWGRNGWENGRLGYPTTDAVCGLRRGGCWQGFQGGTIHWSPATGAHATSGLIRDAWGRNGWENGRLGYPVSGETVSGGVIRQNFQGGSITVDQRTGRVTVR